MSRTAASILEESKKRFAEIDEDADRARLVKLTYQKAIGEGSSPDISELSQKSAGSENIWQNSGGFGLLNANSVSEANASQAQVVTLGSDMQIWLTNLTNSQEQQRLFNSFYSWVYSLEDVEAEAAEAAAEESDEKLKACQDELLNAMKTLGDSDAERARLEDALAACNEKLKESQLARAAGNEGITDEMKREAALIEGNDQLKQENADLQSEKEKLEDELSKLEDALAAAEAAAAQQNGEEDDLGNSVADKNAEIEDLKSQLAVCKNEIETRKNELENIQTKVEDLSSKLDTANQTKEDAEDAKKDAEDGRDAAEQETDDVKKELDDTKRTLERCEAADVDDARKAVDAENKLQQCQNELAECQAENSNLTQQLQNAERKGDEVDGLRAALASCEADAADTASQLQDCVRERNELEKRLADCEQRKAQLKPVPTPTVKKTTQDLPLPADVGPKPFRGRAKPSPRKDLSLPTDFVPARRGRVKPSPRKDLSLPADVGPKPFRGRVKPSPRKDLSLPTDVGPKPFRGRAKPRVNAQSVKKIISEPKPDPECEKMELAFSTDEPHIEKRQGSEELYTDDGVLQVTLTNNNPVGSTIWTPIQMWMTAVDPSTLPHWLQGDYTGNAAGQLKAIESIIEDSMASTGRTLPARQKLNSSSKASAQLQPATVQKIFDEASRAPGTDLGRWLGEPVVLNDGERVNPNGAKLGTPAATFDVRISNATRAADSVQWETEPDRFDLNIRNNVPLKLKGGRAGANLLLISTLWADADECGNKRVQLITDNFLLDVDDLPDAQKKLDIKDCPPCQAPEAKPPTAAVAVKKVTPTAATTVVKKVTPTTTPAPAEQVEPVEPVEQVEPRRLPVGQGDLRLTLVNPNDPIRESRSNVEGTARFDGITVRYEVDAPAGVSGTVNDIILDLSRSIQKTDEPISSQIGDVNRRTETLKYRMPTKSLELSAGDKVIIRIRPSLAGESLPNKGARLPGNKGVIMTFYPSEELFFPAGPQKDASVRSRYLWNLNARVMYTDNKGKLKEANALSLQQYDVGAQTVSDIEARFDSDSSEALIEEKEVSWDIPGESSQFDRRVQSSLEDSSDNSGGWFSNLLGRRSTSPSVNDLMDV